MLEYGSTALPEGGEQLIGNRSNSLGEDVWVQGLGKRGMLEKSVVAPISAGYIWNDQKVR
jgi:hypothetical protein